MSADKTHDKETAHSSEHDKHEPIRTELEGDLIWMPFGPETRKFYEKSYYGNLYTRDKRKFYPPLEKHASSDKKSIWNIDTESLPEEERPGYIGLNIIEALYLIARNKIEVFDKNGRKYSFDTLIEYGLKLDVGLWQKYMVYSEMRKRGYIIRIGYGGDAHFRVFARGARIPHESAKYVYFIIKDGEPVSLSKLDRLVKSVLGDRKELILAIFDNLGDSSFYILEKINFTPLRDPDKLWDKPAVFKDIY